MKTCSTCSILKPLSSYSKKARSKDGYQYNCKGCSAKYKKLWYKENIDSCKVYISVYQRTNRAACAAKEAKRRALKLASSYNTQDISGLYKLAGKLNSLTSSDLHVDHIEPLNHPDVCGLHNALNLQLLNSSDNIRKSNRRDYLTPMDKLNGLQCRHLTIPTCG